MMRLIERGLMYGGLVPIDTPTLVDRYNDALKMLTGRQTSAEHFHVDMSGFSPEIGDEFDDNNYLNPRGCNRQFILLTLDQLKAPLLNANFSSSRAILKHFYEDNRASLFSLTSRAAVAGEMLNSIYRIETVDELLDLRRIRVEADTASSHIAQSKKLVRLIKRFEEHEDAWYDDELTEKMIDLAGIVGDVESTPIELDVGPYEVKEFYTTHFGGLYVFRHRGANTLIFSEKKVPKLKHDNSVAISISDRAGVAEFLEDNNLAESIFDAKNLDPVALLQRRIGAVLADQFARTGMDPVPIENSALRAAAYRVSEPLPDLFHTLAGQLRQCEQGVDIDPLTPKDPAYFYTLRAARGPQRELVNKLLAELCPLDPMQLFICHKAHFYKMYRDWPDPMREFVAQVLARDYIPDKAGAREELFGSDDDTVEDVVIEPDMEGPFPWGRPEGVT